MRCWVCHCSGGAICCSRPSGSANHAACCGDFSQLPIRREDGADATPANAWAGSGALSVPPPSELSTESLDGDVRLIRLELWLHPGSSSEEGKMNNRDTTWETGFAFSTLSATGSSDNSIRVGRSQWAPGERPPAVALPADFPRPNLEAESFNRAIFETYARAAGTSPVANWVPLPRSGLTGFLGGAPRSGMHQARRLRPMLTSHLGSRSRIQA